MDSNFELADTSLNASIISEDRTGTLSQGQIVLSDILSTEYEMLLAYPYRNALPTYSDDCFGIIISTSNSGYYLFKFLNQSGTTVSSNLSVKYHIVYRKRNS